MGSRTVLIGGLLFLILRIGVLRQRVSANISIPFTPNFQPHQSKLTINLHLGGLGLGLSCQLQQLGGETLLSRGLNRTKDVRSQALVVEFFAARSRTLCHCCGICFSFGICLCFAFCFCASGGSPVNLSICWYLLSFFSMNYLVDSNRQGKKSYDNSDKIR